MAQVLSVQANKREQFFLIMSLMMAATVVAGFGSNLLLGRVSIGEQPPIVHLHAFLFFGWMAIYVAQNALVAYGAVDWHRSLGRVALVWVPAMVIVGTIVTVRALRLKGPPPGLPADVLLFTNILSVSTFAALVAAALVLRRRREWHRRLVLCGTSALIGTAIARLLPVPALGALGPILVSIGLMLFPMAGAMRDILQRGRVHPAWYCGLAALLAAQILPGQIGRTAPGHAVMVLVLQDSPQAGLLTHPS